MPFTPLAYSQMEEMHAALLRFQDAHRLLFATLIRVESDLHGGGGPSVERVRRDMKKVEHLIGVELQLFVKNYRDRMPSISLAGLETFIVGQKPEKE